MRKGKKSLLCIAYFSHCEFAWVMLYFTMDLMRGLLMLSETGSHISICYNFKINFNTGKEGIQNFHCIKYQFQGFPLFHLKSVSCLIQFCQTRTI